MRLKQFVVFISVVLLIYLSVNYYIFVSGLALFKGLTGVLPLYYFFFFVFSLSFVLSFYTERRLYNYFINNIITFIGSFWLAAILYFFLCFIILDIGNLIIRLAFGVHHISEFTRHLTGFIITGFVFFLILCSFLRTNIPQIVNLDINIPKNGGTLKKVNIAAVSDIHLGTLIGKKKVRKMVEKINGLHPDIVLLIGDVLSENQAGIFSRDIGEPLSGLSAPLGVFAVPGNHEYIGGMEKAGQYLRSKNITLLIDEYLMIKESFILAGRDDKDKTRFNGIKRKSIIEILPSEYAGHPVILMDHQPVSIGEAVNTGIDLQLSGHTHNGQIFPFNYLVKKLFKIGHGYRKINNSHFFVTSGFGTWGPPVRIGTRSEIINIRLTFEQVN